MKCFYHPAVDSTQGCRTCGRWLCVNCAHSIKGGFYCQDCLVKGAELSALAGNAAVTGESPGRAALFAAVPGMGAVYNREYAKGLIHFSIFAVLCLMADRGPEIFGFAAVAFWVYQMLDAYRSAQARLRRRLARPDQADEEEQINAPVWGIVLLGVGVLFLVDNLVPIDVFRFVDRLWPVALIGLGIYLIFGIKNKSNTRTEAVSRSTEFGGFNPPLSPSSVRDQDKEGPQSL